ncbi:MAG: hypothetical protein LAO20_16190 [Acidobacteriia bacterium]|nr:hypothetical protein [Terriglobia bacterium]
MKALLWLSLLLLVFAVLVVTYTVFHGYTTVFWFRPATVVNVNGRAVKGFVHQSTQAMIITRKDRGVSHSYLVGFRDTMKQPVLDCRTWVAPRSPILLSNHQRPLCLSWFFDDEAPPLTMESPVGAAKIDADHVEFRTRAGDVVRVNR